MPPFALAELGKTFKISTVYGDAKDRNTLPGVDLVKEADVLLLSVRRRNLPKEQLDRIRAHLAAGKGLVGIRTASHAFHQRDKGAPEGLDEWRDFDATVLGGNYTGHHGNDIPTFAKIVPESTDHPVLLRLSAEEFRTFGSLYQTSPLAEGTTVLMTGRAEGIEKTEPVAWTRTGRAVDASFTPRSGIRAISTCRSSAPCCATPFTGPPAWMRCWRIDGTLARRGSRTRFSSSPFPPALSRGESGRGDRIRTCDLVVPNDARYQAALHPEVSVAQL